VGLAQLLKAYQSHCSVPGAMGIPKLILACGAGAAVHASSTSAGANPIRKVVTMLQMMQKKVEAEGEKSKELFDKFMCYCKNSGGDLAKGIADSEDKVSELPSAVEEAEANLKQLKEDLKKAQSDRAAAKAAIAEATAIREKESVTFSKEAGDLKTNIAAVGKAVGALEAGAKGSFLQTQAAQVLKNLVQSNDKLDDEDRHDLTSFLSGGDGDGYAPASGAITGILKQMGDTMAATLADITGTEKASVKSFNQLIKAKTAEIDACTASIEDKMKRIGDLGVKIVGMKEDLSDAEESLVEDKKYLAELEKGCATKEKEWAETCKLRQEEILALADTIKILNDDDALELFKKTLPGASSLLQLEQNQKNIKTQVLSMLQTIKANNQGDRRRLDLIMLALHGKKVGFEKVIKLIDDMVALMKTEQQDDNDKKEYCEMQFDQADDKKKALERTEGKLTASIEDAKETIATLTDEIKALGEGIVALDKSVAEATENRKEENSDFKTLYAGNAAAKEILEFAKNRLNKFYNPKMYKPDNAFAQVHAHDAPPPPPEAPGPAKKQESGGVIAMIDTLIKELDMEMTEGETEEKLAQEDYEELMADSAKKRAADTKSLADKESQKGDLEAELVTLGDDHKATIKELMATEKYIGNLHGECDWLLQYFDVRKEARSGEIDALGKAKAVLNGADFGFLVQTKSTKFLMRA
jgi:peptidoglycan hydrolase CwlO-like protein